MSLLKKVFAEINSGKNTLQICILNECTADPNAGVLYFTTKADPQYRFFEENITFTGSETLHRWFICTPCIRGLPCAVTHKATDAGSPARVADLDPSRARPQLALGCDKAQLAAAGLAGCKPASINIAGVNEPECAPAHIQQKIPEVASHSVTGRRSCMA